MVFEGDINEKVVGLAILKKKSEVGHGPTYFDNMWVRIFLENYTKLSLDAHTTFKSN